MATVTSGSASTSVAVVVAERANRSGLTLENTDTNPAYVLLGAGTVSSTNFSFTLDAASGSGRNAFLPACSDRVSVIWGTAGSGKIFITEYN